MRANLQELESPRRWGEIGVTSAERFGAHGTESCSTPHWGYVVRGSVRVAYPDHDEVISAGDAYYVAPGHVAIDVGEAELVDFSPLPGPRWSGRLSTQEI